MDAEPQVEEPKVYTHKYGYKALFPIPPLELELLCFVQDWEGNAEKHFKNVVKLLWPKGSHAHFIWHPWAEDMLREACVHTRAAVKGDCQTRLALHGCASSGKTDWAAVWGIVNWLVAPNFTMVLATSTNLSASRLRIWGSITKYFNYASIKLPGKLTDSRGIIRTDDGTGKFSDKCGIILIAGEQSSEKESIKKIIGLKNKRVFLIGDELPELSPALVMGATSNLTSNPTFQFIALGNFNSIYDPLGEFCEPVKGWKSITPEDTRWENLRGGVSLRFDGLKSPNLLAGEDKWPILTSKKIAYYKANLKGLQLWRMLRSFPCPSGDEQLIITEADLISGEAASTIYWDTKPIAVGALDPGFTNEGDRSALLTGWWGLSVEGIWTLLLREPIILSVDVEKMGHIPQSYQIAAQFREKCKELGIAPKHAGLDCTGAGIPFLHIVQEKWDPNVYGVQFGGKASDLPVSALDTRPSHEQYANRVSELWYTAVDFIAYRQVRGVTPDLARELTVRYYSTRKSGANVRIVVEPKKDMKVRLGFSPDIADARMILLDLIRTRLGGVAGTKTMGAPVRVQSFSDAVAACDMVYTNVTYEAENEDYRLMGYAED